MQKLGCRSGAIKVYPKHISATKTFQLLLSPGALSLFAPVRGAEAELKVTPQRTIRAFWVSHLVEQNPFCLPAMVYFSVCFPSPQVAPPLPSRREAKPPPPPPKTRKSSVVSSEQGLQWGFGVLKAQQSSGCFISSQPGDLPLPFHHFPGAFLGNATKELVLGLDSLPCLPVQDWHTNPDWNSPLSCSCLCSVSSLLQSQQLLPSVTGNAGVIPVVVSLQGPGVSCLSQAFCSACAWFATRSHFVLFNEVEKSLLLEMTEAALLPGLDWQHLHGYQDFTGTSSINSLRPVYLSSVLMKILLSLPRNNFPC